MIKPHTLVYITVCIMRWEYQWDIKRIVLDLTLDGEVKKKVK